jgi:hypothetical protein
MGGEGGGVVLERSAFTSLEGPATKSSKSAIAFVLPSKYLDSYLNLATSTFFCILPSSLFSHYRVFQMWISFGIGNFAKLTNDKEGKAP